MSDTYAAIAEVARRLVAGEVLRANDVTVGRGIVIDWRTVKCGDEFARDACAFDTAQAFVSLVGPVAALEACGIVAAPEVTAFAPNEHGARRRSFLAGEFRVFVEPNDDDAAQAEFTVWIANMAAQYAREVLP